MNHHDSKSPAQVSQYVDLPIVVVAGALHISQTDPSGAGWKIIFRSQFTNLLHIGLTILAICLALSSSFAADLIPTERRTVWLHGNTVGVFGGIPTGRTEFTNLVTAGADNTGVTSCSALLQSLVNLCPSNKYVYVPAGDYRVTTKVTVNGSTNHWSLKGDGINVTKFFPAQGFFGLDNWSYTAPVRVHLGLDKAVTNFSVTADVSASVGFNCKIDSENRRTNANVIATDQTARLVQQVSKVISVANGTNVTIWPPLYIDHPADLDPWFYYQTGFQSEGVGFEDFSIHGTNEVTHEAQAAGFPAFTWFGSRNNFWKRVGFVDLKDFSISLSGDLWSEVRECYFDYTHTALGGSGAGLIITANSSGYILENNYGRNVNSPFIEANCSSGYVVGFNYITNAVSNDFHAGNTYDNHIPHSYMFLVENNWGNMYQQDAYFGSASHGTLYKNFFGGYDPIKTGIPRCIDLNRWSVYFNLLGNVLGDTRSAAYWYTTTNRGYSQTQPVIYRFGFPFPGNTTYGHSAALAMQTPATHWAYPGTNAFVGFITSATGCGTDVTGTFDPNLTNGLVLTIQSQLNTNLYYPAQTNYPRLANVGISGGLKFNKSICWTNGDAVYASTPDYFNQLHAADIATHFLHGNYDRTNNAQLWDVTGTTTESNLPPSLYIPLAEWPRSWMTNKAGVALGSPVNPTNGNLGDWNARSIWEDAAIVQPDTTKRARHGVGKGAKPKR